MRNLNVANVDYTTCKFNYCRLYDSGVAILIAEDDVCDSITLTEYSVNDITYSEGVYSMPSYFTFQLSSSFDTSHFENVQCLLCNVEGTDIMSGPLYIDP